ncbi:DUF362 domain-containing protein [Chloroflexota bacterium]
MDRGKSSQNQVTRRDFLKLAGLGAAGVIAVSCKADLNSTKPTAILTSVSEPEVSAKFEHKAAIAQARDYDPAILHNEISGLLDHLGGLDDVVRSGDSVALKVNLVGGSYYKPYPGVDPVESYVTHPNVTRALGELLLDAGARQLYIVEALFDHDSFARWGYTDVADSLGATLIDLNNPDPYTEFASMNVGDGWFIYDNFKLNPLLNDVDAFISVSKMKCHFSVGVTHSMKNLVGLTPVQHYRTSTDHYWRSDLHGGDYGPKRLPRAIIDLNRARPINLALVDGVKAAEGGEVPRGSFRPVEPGVLISGKNPVATDAVATAVMGFDPTAEYPAAPFLHGENYLNLARDLGLGSNDLEKIEVAGVPIEDVRFEFSPSTKQSYNDDHTVQVM